MQYIALLRGINVGGNHKVDMKALKSQLASYGFADISTYINTGNIILESEKSLTETDKVIKECLEKHYDFPIPLLLKTAEEMKNIAEAIPKDWQNDTTHKTNIAYLFREADSSDIIDKLPVKKEFLDMRYTPGAIFWRVERENYNKSQLNKLASHSSYRIMTIRNVNTARKLAEL